jgi:hypothetical protein
MGTSRSARVLVALATVAGLVLAACTSAAATPKVIYVTPETTPASAKTPFPVNTSLWRTPIPTTYTRITPPPTTYTWTLNPKLLPTLKATP